MLSFPRQQRQPSLPVLLSAQAKITLETCALDNAWGGILFHNVTCIYSPLSLPPSDSLSLPAADNFAPIEPAEETDFQFTAVTLPLRHR